jgi:dTDP-4-amino-4,6-dideoxygalactose transaminase
MNELPFAVPDISDLEIEAVTTCLRSGWLTTGKRCAEFEQMFSAFIGVEHAVAVSSATNAALLVMEALGVDRDWEVLVPAYTFSGPAMMAHKLGATVTFVDVGPDSYQMDPEALRAALGRKGGRRRLVMPTHFAGQSCDMASIVSLARQEGCSVVDDAAHALPTWDEHGRIVGDQGADATFYSFYATKTLTSGEGGMIVTGNDAIAAKVRSLRSHGFSRQVFDRYTSLDTGWFYDVASGGWKANLTDLAASIGIAQLRRLEEMTAKRRDLAAIYMAGLSKEEGLVLPEFDNRQAWHLFPIQVHGDRDAFIGEMKRQGIHCSVHFIPLHFHSFWKSIVHQPEGTLSNTERMFAGEVSLPLYSKMTALDAQRVVEAVKTANAAIRTRTAPSEASKTVSVHASATL